MHTKEKHKTMPIFRDNCWPPVALPDTLSEQEVSALTKIGNRPLGDLIKDNPALLVFPHCLGNNSRFAHLLLIRQDNPDRECRRFLRYKWSWSPYSFAFWFQWKTILSALYASEGIRHQYAQFTDDNKGRVHLGFSALSFPFLPEKCDAPRYFPDLSNIFP